MLRPAAKRQSSQEAQVSLNVDVSVDVGSDTTMKIPHKTGKSKARIVVQRVVRALRMITVIAVVNIPLHMMLLFKDWIDQ